MRSRNQSRDGQLDLYADIASFVNNFHPRRELSGDRGETRASAIRRDALTGVHPWRFFYYDAAELLLMARIHRYCIPAGQAPEIVMGVLHEVRVKAAPVTTSGDGWNRRVECTSIYPHLCR